ncbi:poliovirus receptor homolog [Thalassophryne amazonica]|uniref:poliovirus receptor homolog n=1 Tax=Thalassophryne amazonica TaxID=390379 RepID=UPI0014716E19|nr:poliovirus receptor homolog [Thalassophryne amazonica]
MSLNISSRGSVSFECSSDANPMPNYTWSRSGQPMPESVCVDGPTLTFLSTTSDLNGLYICEASNPYGSKVGQIFVHFKSGPCTVCWALFTVFALIAAAVATAFEIRFFRCKHCPRYFHYIRPDQPPSHASPSLHACAVMLWSLMS